MIVNQRIVIIIFWVSVPAITIDELPSPNAYAGDYVNVTLANFDQQHMAVGYILSDPAFPVPVASKFEARVVIFNVTVPITRGYPVRTCHYFTEKARM